MSMVPVPAVRAMYMFDTTIAFIVKLPSMLNTVRPTKSPVPTRIMPLAAHSTSFAWRFKLAVSRVVVDVESVTVSVPAIRRLRVAIVNVWAVPPDELNVRWLNSDSLKLLPAKVMVPPTTDVKVTVPVPASHTIPSVEAFVQVPVTVQASLPKSMALNADEMFTFPVTDTVPDVLVRSPPDIVSDAAENVNVLLASIPPETVSALATTQFVPIVTVPPWTVIALNVLSVDKRAMLNVPLNWNTLVVPSANVEPVPDVSQAPVTVHVPVVTTMVPDAPPVIVTAETVTADALAVKMLALPATKPPPSMDRPAVASSVVDVVSLTVSVVAHRSPRVARVQA